MRHVRVGSDPRTKHLLEHHSSGSMYGEAVPRRPRPGERFVPAPRYCPACGALHQDARAEMGMLDLEREVRELAHAIGLHLVPLRG